jgi:hypothetical protein
MGVSMDNLSAAISALDELVRADGATFVLQAVSDDGDVQLRLVVDVGSDPACLECLAPPELLATIASDRLRRDVAGVTKVSIVDPRTSP